MGLKISTKGRYALRLMVDLAQNNNGEFISLKDVAGRQDVSMKYLEQIVSQLTRAGYLHSVRGPLGGYKLVREPAGYTVAEVLRVTEGNLAPVACLELERNLCARSENCLTLPVWEGLYRGIARYLESITLQDIIDGKVDAP